MFSRLITVYRNPAERRKWLTIASGLFIAAALVAFCGFGQAAPWAPPMPRSWLAMTSPSGRGHRCGSIISVSIAGHRQSLGIGCRHLPVRR